MKGIANMYGISSKLWFDKRWISKSGDVSLYLQVTLKGKHKEFPLKLKWPVDLIDLPNDELLPRRKNDPDVDDYNLLIKMDQSKHTEILRTYRIKKAPIDIKIFAKEAATFDNKESFAAYMHKHIKFRFDTKEIVNRTYRNHKNVLVIMMKFEVSWPYEMIDVKWMRRFKTHLISKKYATGNIWTIVKTVKAYLAFASKEPMMFVNPDAVAFPNPEPNWKTTFLNKNEVRKLIELFFARNITELQQRVLAAFLYQCFTSLRISDIYRVNSKWKLTDGFLDFIPKKNERAQKWLHIPIMPMAKQFIYNTAGVYFKLPNEAEYNIQLKLIAKEAGISKKLTSHIGRHTFGHIFMTTIGNLKGLQEIMGHAKIETTMRYAHLDDDYQTKSVVKMQEGFADLMVAK